MRLSLRTQSFLAAAAAAILVTQAARAQQPAPVAKPAPGGALNAVGDGFFGPGQQGNQGNAPTNGAQGGAASADFDSLIDLITSTVEAESWAENGTGEGDIQPFFNGVYVDAAGALSLRAAVRPALTSIRAKGAPSAPAPKSVAAAAPRPEHSARNASPLRYVSLPKLEAAIADAQHRKAPLDPAMLTLAGLQRVSYVLVYPESGDLVLAGPAGDWQTTPSGAIVSSETGRPVIRLDDLLTLWRRQRAEKSSAFGCSIVPRQEALERTQQYLTVTGATPLEPGTRRKWLAGMRDALGVQDVQFEHIDPNTRVAALLLAADYHMKLVGMGLAEGVPGVKSYLATVRVGPGGQLPPTTVLRWWFNMPSTTVEATAEGDAFALADRCVEVLSENEMLAARGQRVHTGDSEPLNRQFAQSFTKEFVALSDKYPVYGELQRVFELSLALSLAQREGLTEKAAWTPTLLLDSERLRLPKVNTPKTVETVVNHRVVGGRHIIAGISGGVRLDVNKSLTVAKAPSSATKELASAKQAGAQGDDSTAAAWWWD